MPPHLPSKPSADDPAGPAAAPVNRQPRRALHNFVVLAVFQVVVRVGWIFKTETVIMPAVLDTLSGAAWMRGCLPLLNRFGQSVPPLLATRQIKIMPHKRAALALSTFGMAATFALLAMMWLVPGVQAAGWAPLAFLLFYGAFFSCMGIHQLAFSTLQGKIVPVTRRGRLLWISNLIGVACAAAAALALMPRWLSGSGGRFDLLFGFPALCFAAAAGLTLLVDEPTDNYHEPRDKLWKAFSKVGEPLVQDANFRRFAIAATLAGTSMMLFPHHQKLGRDRLDLTFDNFVWWVVVQNVGTAVFSMFIGMLADSRGNRSALNFTHAGVALTPLVALALSHAGAFGASTYTVVFLLLGLMPLNYRVLANYALEIAPPAEHPRYLSTLTVCLTVPAILSPATGWLLDQWGYDPVFLLVSILSLAGWVMSFWIIEPRHHIPFAEAPLPPES